jgi:membrane-associated phospholipid phosphatase
MFKYLSGRLRPNHPANSSKLNGPFFTDNSSFPSQHATLAFAAARVYAMEYRDKPAVPIISYSIASLITISRLTENKHWATDLIAGTLLGWACGTQVVNNYHRYAKLVRTGKTNKKKGKLTFNMQYLPEGGLIPGMVYTFR